MKNYALIVMCAAVAALSGCATTAGSMSYSDSSMQGMTPANKAPQNSGRMIIRNASLDVDVRDIDAAVGNASTIIAVNNGFIESRSDRNSGKRTRLNIRVPSENLDTTIAELETLGSVTSRGINSRDVTAEYVDIGARLQSLVALRDRMKALLDKAETINEILAIEREFTRVQSEIDSIEARMKRLEGQVTLSTIDLTLDRKPVLGPVGFVGKWLIRGVGALFVIRD